MLLLTHDRVSHGEINKVEEGVLVHPVMIHDVGALAHGTRADVGEEHVGGRLEGHVAEDLCAVQRIHRPEIHHIFVLPRTLENRVGRVRVVSQHQHIELGQPALLVVRLALVQEPSHVVPRNGLRGAFEELAEPEGGEDPLEGRNELSLSVVVFHDVWIRGGLSEELFGQFWLLSHVYSAEPGVIVPLEV